MARWARWGAAVSSAEDLDPRCDVAGQQIGELAGVAQGDAVSRGDLVGTIANLSATTRRRNLGGKNRSSVHSTNLVVAAGQAVIGHGCW
jgi:hypothetical protein